MDNPPQRQGTFPTLLPSPDARLPMQLLPPQHSPRAPLHAAVAQMGDVTRRSRGYMTLTLSHSVVFLRYPHSNISSVSLHRTRVCLLLLRAKVAAMAVDGACAGQLSIRLALNFYVVEGCTGTVCEFMSIDYTLSAPCLGWNTGKQLRISAHRRVHTVRSTYTQKGLLCPSELEA